MTFSVIVCNIDPAKLRSVRATYEKALAPEEFEFIAIHDAKGLAEGYNRGIAQSRGEILIFSHDDIDILSPNLSKILREGLKECDLIGVAGTTRLIHPCWWFSGPPYIFGQIANPAPQKPGFINVQIFGAPSRCVRNIQALDGVFMATTRELVLAQPFDQNTFDGFHYYDVDFSFTAHLAGRKICVRNDIQLLHQSCGTFEQPAYLKNADRFLQKRGAQLEKADLRGIRWSLVVVPNIREALEVMNPPYWNDD